MKRSIFIKVFLTTAVLLALLALVFLLFSFQTIRAHYLRTLARDLENLSRVLRPIVLSYLEGEKFGQLDRFLKDQGRDIRTRLTVIDRTGKVLADSEDDPALMENHRFRPEVLEALQGRKGQALRYSSTVKEDMLYVALPLEKEGSVVGVIRASLFISEINILLSSTKRDIVTATGIIVALAFLGAYLFSRSLTRPIRELASAFRRVAAGNFETKMSLRFKDEWKDVASSFNAMTEQIRSLLTDLRSRKEEMDSILASIREALLVLDKAGKIVLSNPSARKIFGQDSLEGKFYWQVIRAAAFADLVEGLRKEKGSCSRQINLGERIYLGSASFLEAQDRMVIVLSDLTEVEALARVKRDLVLNIAHELRTPLTAIKGFAETLAGEVGDSQKTYVNTILRHTDRLVRIVDNLLLLSRLEEPSTELERKAVDVSSLVANVLKLFEPKAKEKDLALSFEVSADLPVIEADPFLLEQVVINLVDNALKYTDRGEVRVFLARKGSCLVLEVADTGIGIPEEDRQRIFERFYVVDKSRSRKLGGSGLGLSIAKHIVNLHGGMVEVDSRIGEGSRFRVILPLSPYRDDEQ